MIKGNLHSIETMGLLDGPGIRTVFFLQGCPLRCQYCHNPDSQNYSSDQTIMPEEVVEMALKYKSYYDRSGGGVTFSGGEPLLQGRFLTKTLKLLKENGIHTTVDTCGVGDKRYYKEIFKYTDLIMLDLKHSNSKGYKELTGISMNAFDYFLDQLDENYENELIIRHVMVPGITDNDESAKELLEKVSYLSYTIDKIEILPYHKMGITKYEDLDIDYQLDGVPEMDRAIAKEYEISINKSLEKMKSSYERKII